MGIDVFTAGLSLMDYLILAAGILLIIVIAGLIIALMTESKYDALMQKMDDEEDQLELFKFNEYIKAKKDKNETSPY